MRKGRGRSGKEEEVTRRGREGGGKGEKGQGRRRKKRGGAWKEEEDLIRGKEGVGMIVEGR
jgi:hypothetical protein